MNTLASDRYTEIYFTRYHFKHSFVKKRTYFTVSTSVPLQSDFKHAQKRKHSPTNPRYLTDDSITNILYFCKLFWVSGWMKMIKLVARAFYNFFSLQGLFYIYFSYCLNLVNSACTFLHRTRLSQKWTIWQQFCYKPVTWHFNVQKCIFSLLTPARA